MLLTSRPVASLGTVAQSGSPVKDDEDEGGENKSVVLEHLHVVKSDAGFRINIIHVEVVTERMILGAR